MLAPSTIIEVWVRKCESSLPYSCNNAESKATCIVGNVSRPNLVYIIVSDWK
jgi:hypothetical protein